MPNNLGMSDDEYAQIGFYASLMGLTPEQYVVRMNEGAGGDPTTFNNRVAATNADPNSALWYDQKAAQHQNELQKTWDTQGVPMNQRQSAQQLSDYVGTRQNASDPYLAQNRSIIDQTIGANGTLQGQNQANAQNLANQAQWLGGANAGLIGQSWNSTNNANAQDQQTLGTYRSAVGNAGAWDQANIGQLQGSYGQMQQLQAGGYGANVVSQGASTYANPQLVAQQQQQYQALAGIGAGQLNQTAKLAYANPMDIANQQAAAGELSGIANGSKDVNIGSLQSYFPMESATKGALDYDFEGSQSGKDLYAASKGSKDIHVGQEDPGAYASLQDALGKYTAGTELGVSPQERLMYETARLNQEQDERASREASLQGLRQRGAAGSGYEVASNQLGTQQNSTNRMLSDMAALAAAQDRQQKMLAGQAGVAGEMNSQANQIADSNANRQLGALSQYADLDTQVGVGNQDRRYDATKTIFGADVATQNANKDRQTQGAIAASNAYAELRQQGFSEEYSRTEAQNTMARFNADLQFRGTAAASDAAATMRGQDSQEAQYRATSADTMGRFNKEQSQISQRWQEQYAADQQQQAWGRSTDMFSANNTVGRNYMTDQGNLASASFGTTASADARNQGSIQTTRGLNNDWVSATQNAAGTQIGVNNAGIANNWAGAGALTGNNDASAANERYKTSLGIANLSNIAGANAGDYATTIAQGRAAADNRTTVDNRDPFTKFLDGGY